jgi:hypothetical protein
MSQKISTYRERIGPKEIFTSLFFGALMAVGMAAFAAINAKNIYDIIFAFLGMTALFFSILFLLKIHWVNKKKVVIFEDGIELYNQLNDKRAMIEWQSILGVKFCDDFLDKSYALETNNPALKISIPYPLRDIKSFLTLVNKYAGQDHILAVQIKKLIT